jgi:hypothetical protein
MRIKKFPFFLEIFLGSKIVERFDIPSSLEFIRNHVSKNLPLVIRNALTETTAFKKWNSKYLRYFHRKEIIYRENLYLQKRKLKIMYYAIEIYFYNKAFLSSFYIFLDLIQEICAQFIILNQLIIVDLLVYSLILTN